MIKGGVVKGHKKKKIESQEEEKNRRPEAKESVCQGLSLIPINRDTQIDLKTETVGVVNGHSKKNKNGKPRRRRKKRRRIESIIMHRLD